MSGIFSQFDSQDLNRLAAKGILEKLRNIRQRINVDFTARRLIWELIQNAKDNAATCNINGNPNVKIEIDLKPNQLRFSHNNGYFTNENIRGLIRRYSSSEKDREIDATAPPPATTGRFGIGFMTTHLLSETVQVNGFFQENHDSYCEFNLPLDRTGQTEREIIQSIERVFLVIEENINKSEKFKISEAQKFKTEFIYKLNDAGHELAKISIAEFDNCVAYTLINIPNIERVSIKQNGESHYYEISKINEFQTDDYLIEIIEVKSNNHHSSQKHYATLLEDNTRIIIPISYTQSQIGILNPSKNVPRLFLDFPMIGTEDLNIPFVINNSLFEPTEPRDGVSLTGSDDKDTLINSNIVIKAFGLYNAFIEFACKQENWTNLFNLARIKKPKEKVWINPDWFKNNIIQPTQSKLLVTPIVDSNSGNRTCIKDSEGNNLIYFPSSSKAEVRERIWLLTNDLFPENLPIKKHIHEWHDIIWNECFEQTLEELTKGIQKYENLKNLSAELNKTQDETIEWLNEYFDLLNFEAKFIDEIIKDKYSVLPNQKGNFKRKSELFWGKKIEEELKNVLEILDINIRNQLRDDRIISASKYSDNKTGQITHYVKEQKEIINQINEQLKSNQNSRQAINHLISLFCDSEDFPKERYSIYDFSMTLLGDEVPEKKKIETWEESLWEYSDKARINRLLKTISVCESLEALQTLIKSESTLGTKKWLQSFIDFLESISLSGKLNINKNPILPNQNGFFKIKDDIFLDNGSIDEGLKDIAEELGYKVRDELLDSDISLELPENRVRTQVQVAEEISKLIKPILRDLNEREENKDVIRKLYLWMNKNRSVAEQIFGEIYEKRFLLISDDEITANIEKAEILDEIISKTGLSPKEIKEKLITLLTDPKLTEQIRNIGSSIQSIGNLYPEGSEEDILISPDLLDFSSERSRISASEEAKQKIFETLLSNGFIVPNNLSIDFTIVSGISRPDGTPIKIVVKSAKSGRVYFNPNEWIALTEADTQLFVLTRGNIVRNVTLTDLEKINDNFHMRFSTQAFAVNTNLKAFADFFRYLPYTHFVFETPESTTNYLEEFGLNKRNPSADTLSSDDKNLLR